ncbi:unnamed protein product [Cladocopium goreaui]|uniref:Uncharacterized protein n=1 Tax=Cladocopium goreaui TaxID=2562237 RepID=A0A9P1GJ16_9DINO|nr:unnamed protein product [Cladocopium goreaui]
MMLSSLGLLCPWRQLWPLSLMTCSSFPFILAGSAPLALERGPSPSRSDLSCAQMRCGHYTTWLMRRGLSSSKITSDQRMTSLSLPAPLAKVRAPLLQHVSSHRSTSGGQIYFFPRDGHDATVRLRTAVVSMLSRYESHGRSRLHGLKAGLFTRHVSTSECGNRSTSSMGKVCRLLQQLVVQQLVVDDAQKYHHHGQLQVKQQVIERPPESWRALESCGGQGFG